MSIHYRESSRLPCGDGRLNRREKRSFLHQIFLEYEEDQKNAIRELAINASCKETMVHIYGANPLNSRISGHLHAKQTSLVDDPRQTRTHPMTQALQREQCPIQRRYESPISRIKISSLPPQLEMLLANPCSLKYVSVL